MILCFSDSLQTKFLAAVVESKQDFADFDSYLALVQDSLASNFGYQRDIFTGSWYSNPNG